MERRMMIIYPGQIAHVCSISPRASKEEIARLVERWGSLPKDYLDVLAYANGFEAFIISNPEDIGPIVNLFPIDEVFSTNAQADWLEDSPSYLQIGSSLGGEAYMIDLAARPSGMPYIEIPTLDLGFTKPGDGIENRFPTFDAMINELRNRAEIMSE